MGATRGSDPGRVAKAAATAFGSRLWRRRRRSAAALEQALSELADAHVELAHRQSFTDALLETIEVGIVSCDAQGVFVVSNRAERAIFGLQAEGLTGLLPQHLPGLIDVFDPAGKALTVEEYPLMRTLRGDDVSSVDVLVGPAGGPYREIVVRGSQITGPDGEVLGAVAALSDVTELAMAERAAQRANTFFDAVLTASPDYTFVTDLATGAIVYGSPGKDILGITTEKLEALGPEAIAALVHPEDKPALGNLMTAVENLNDGQSIQLRYRSRHVDGSWRWLGRSVTPFRRGKSGAVIEALAVVRDVTDLVEVEERLTHAARHDHLTGLPNRAQLLETLDAALERSTTDKQEVAVLFCDLDGFKRVNDTGGHSAGDAVLTETARRLRTVLREADTVARVGGDEFVIVVEPWNRAERGQHIHPDAARPQGRSLAMRVAERVTEALRQPITIKDVEHVVTASIGITYANRARGEGSESPTADEVLHHADAAMYRAKDRGKNRYELFDHDLTNPVDHRDTQPLLAGH